MPRRKRLEKPKEIIPDWRFGNVIVTKFINKLLKQGKRSIAQSIFYDSMDIIKKKVGQEPMTVFEQALANVKPLLEVKPRRVGGATYQVPVEVRPARAEALAMRWIIGFARDKEGKAMVERLADEFLAASRGEGSAVKKKEDMHKMAEANKAFAHYRW